jgi:hypothetical protein
MDPNQDLQVSRERATRDLEHIKQLREFTPFHAYMMRRLRMKRDVIEDRFRTDPTSKCSHEEREILRRLLMEYDNELLSLLDNDEASARRTLETQRPGIG